MKPHPQLADVRKALSGNMIPPAHSSHVLGGGRPAFQYPRIPLPFVVDTDRPG